MSGNAAANFAESLVASELLTPMQLEELASNLSPQFLEPVVLARELVRRGWLTSLQARRILSGRGASLRVGPYLLLENLGSGLTGKVYKARHTTLNRIVALRLFNPALLVGSEAPRRLQRDVNLVGRVDHPGLVRVLEASGVGTTPYIAAECVDGVDLGTLVQQRGRQPMTDSCEWIRQAAVALDHAHRSRMVHGDIRPSHLLVDRAGQTAKVLDLGLTHWRPDPNHPAHRASASEGDDTLPFRAPECVGGQPAGPQADVFGLGMVLHTLLAGKFPGAGPLPPLDRLRKDVSHELALVVTYLTAQRPEERPTAAQTADLLQPFCAGFGDSVDFSMDGLTPIQASGITMAAHRGAGGAVSAALREPTPFLGGSGVETTPSGLVMPTGEPGPMPAETPKGRSLSTEVVVGLIVLVVVAVLVFVFSSLNRPAPRTTGAATPMSIPI